MEPRLIGRVIATEKKPTSVDTFAFWTDSKLILNPFDIVRVDHVNGSRTYGMIEDISHITDASSFLTNYISSDFGDVEVTPPTFRVGMNYVDAKVICNTNSIYIPVQSDAKVWLADEKEIIYTLGLDNKHCILPSGFLGMYENNNKVEKVIIPVKLDPRFVIGPEGAHLNISGISGLAAKTSYAMFLLKAVQDSYRNVDPKDGSVAFVLFNVKGKDLMGLHLPNDFLEDGKNTPEQAEEERKQVHALYEKMGLSTTTFDRVQYLVPNGEIDRAASNTFLSEAELDDYIQTGKAR